ncbi:MAG: class I SAM-dependent methyltransferase [Defluviitaleaceae bacterium]|nr:class I SAM-dependent methyltransferase [Defluviitaleaceae bacterium]
MCGDVKLSPRLMAVADLVRNAIDAGTADGTFADIGCDHGLLVAYLVKNKVVSYAVASDIKQGPVDAALRTFGEHGITNFVNTRLGPGLVILAPGEVFSCAIAGMGGGTVISILNESSEVVASLGQLVLSPQRDIAEVRKYLHANGFYIHNEIITHDDGHYYFAIDARRGNEPPYDEVGYLYGQRLLERADKALHAYLLWERDRYAKIYDKIKTCIANSDTSIQYNLRNLEKSLVFFG